MTTTEADVTEQALAAALARNAIDPASCAWFLAQEVLRQRNRVADRDAAVARHRGGQHVAETALAVARHRLAEELPELREIADRARQMAAGGLDVHTGVLSRRAATYIVTGE